MSPTSFSRFYSRKLPVNILCLMATFVRSATSVTIKVNATSSLFRGTGSSSSTSASPNVSMCAVAQNGLAPVGDGPPAPEDYSTACSCSDLVHSFASVIPSPYRYLHTLTAFETYTTPTDPNYLPPQDCCIQCWITARDVQVFYWPVEIDTQTLMNTSAPEISTPQSLISNGITFVSPSVYVAYRNLRASDVCPSFGYGDFTRGRAYNTTIAYPPGFLSTSMCTGEPEGFYQGYAALNLTKLQYPTSYNGTCWGLDVTMESTTNGPYLSMPPDLTRADPAWSTCDVVYWGAFDPPIALHTATALVPDPGKGSPPTPAPGSPVAPPHAPPTPTALPVDPGKPATQSPAPKADPQDPRQQSPHPSDPIKSPTNNQSPNPQDPDKQDTNPPGPVQPPAHDNSGDPAASTAIPTPPNGANAAPGDPSVVSDPQTNDPQPAGGANEGNPGADPSDGQSAGPALHPAQTPNQSPADPAQPLPSIGGHRIQAASGGGIIIASTTLQPGVQTTIDSTPISVDKDSIVIASSTIPLALPYADPIITLINGDVISAGGKAAIVSGTTVALAPHDDALIVDGKPSPIPQPSTPIITAAGQTLTPASTGFAIGSQSVLPGGPAVMYAGSTLSLAPEGTALIVNGKTTPLAPAAPTVFTAGSQTFTTAPTGFAVGTQSIFPGGPAVAVDGALVSLGSSELVIGASTVPLGSAVQGGRAALGSLIVGGFGGGGSPTGGGSNGSDVVAFTGGVGGVRVGGGTVTLALVGIMGAAVVALEIL